MISKITKNVRKYRNVIKSHHIIAIFEAVNLDVKPVELQRFKDFNSSFNEKFDINKTLAGKIQKNLELEVFIKILLVQILWR